MYEVRVTMEIEKLCFILAKKNVLSLELNHTRIYVFVLRIYIRSQSKNIFSVLVNLFCGKATPAKEAFFHTFFLYSIRLLHIRWKKMKIKTNIKNIDKRNVVKCILYETKY